MDNNNLAGILYNTAGVKLFEAVWVPLRTAAELQVSVMDFLGILLH